MTSPKPERRQSAGGAYAEAMREAGPYLGLGLQIMFSMGFFAGLGYLVDGWLGIGPWGLIAGCVLGMVAVFALLFRLAGETSARSVRERQARREAAGEGTTKTGR